MFGPPSAHEPVPSNPNDPGGWSTLIYEVPRDLPGNTADRLRRAMCGKYGQNAKVQVQYAAAKGSLHFRCGEVRNLSEMQAFRKHVAGLVQGLNRPATLLYPTS